ncbi:hypothetical protein GA0061098_101813 [Bradyrhizobium shewense]|uniref:Uncharacterized protein n=1 Tax=Bradyrhizobium shewense TaxID=1761772 RepID=A0A1C3XKD9_9BRAD|nr:hypothetical protein GA0061098_101813 [Bradyrhizobium shewense]
MRIGPAQHANPCDVNDMNAKAAPFSPVGAIANLHENNEKSGIRE